MNIISLHSKDTKTRRILKSLIALSVPLIVGELGSIAQQFADTIMVGHHTTIELAASGMVNNILYFFIFFVLGISYAITPLVGNAFGRGNKREAIRILIDGVTLNLLIGLGCVFLLGLLLSNIEILGQPDEILDFARPYFKWLMASIPLLTVFLAQKQYLDGLGKTGVSMWIILGANLLNILLNWFLIYGKCGFPELGLRGAGISTFVSRFAQLFAISIVVGITILKDKRESDFTKKDFSPQWSGMAHQFKLGLPVGIQLGLELSIFSACAIFMGWLGTNELAAHQAMYTVSTLCFQILYGIGAANCILISQYCGEGDIEGARKCPKVAFLSSLCVIFFVTLLIVVLFDPLSSCFTVSQDVKYYMRAILPGFILYQVGDCLQCTYGNALRGIEATKPLMICSFIAYVLVCIPLSAILGNAKLLGAWGVWMGAPIGLTLAGILFYLNYQKRIKIQQEILVYSKTIENNKPNTEYFFYSTIIEKIKSKQDELK